MSDIKQALLNHMLSESTENGWNNETLEQCAEQLGLDRKFVYVLFPKGASDVLTNYMRALDQEMIEILKTKDMSTMRVRDRAILAIKTRLELLDKHKDAISAILAFTAIPSHSLDSAESLAITCDEMWKAIGDKSTNFSYYTKRFLLGSIYSSTLLYWLKDTSPGYKETWRFLDSRLQELFKLIGAKNKLSGSIASGFGKLGSLFKK